LIEEDRDDPLGRSSLAEETARLERLAETMSPRPDLAPVADPSPASSSPSSIPDPFDDLLREPSPVAPIGPNRRDRLAARRRRR
jgi:hypothetical protein